MTASADFARISRSDLLDTELDKPETQFADAEILFRYAKYKGYRMADETDRPLLLTATDLLYAFRFSISEASGRRALLSVYKNGGRHTLAEHIQRLAWIQMSRPATCY